MNRLNDVKILDKVDMIVKEKLPGFASRYFNHYMDVKAPGTLYGYAIDLVSFFDYISSVSINTDEMVISDMDKITPDVIENYLEHSKTYMEKGLVKTRSDSAVKRRYSSLSSFISYYYDLDMINTNPVRKVRPPNPMKYKTRIPSDDSENDLLEFVSDGSYGGRSGKFHEHTRNRDTAIIMLIMHTGIKASECVSINLDDIHLDEGYLTVRKRGSQRNIYIPGSISDALSRYLAERLSVIPCHGHDDALFLSLRHKRICLRTIEIMVKRYSSAVLGKENAVTPEALKQAFKNRLIRQATPIFDIADICGNKKETLIRRFLPQYEL